MALKLWMPMNQDLRQQGLSSIIPTQTSGFTKISAGKLGACYKFTSVFDTLLPISEWDWTTGSVSFGCWAKISKTELAALVATPSYSSTYTTMGGTLLGRDSYGGLAIRWQTNNIYTDSTLNKLYVYTHMRNTSSATHQTGSQEVPFDTWFHIMTVVDRTENQIKLYLNGELVKSVALTMTGTFTTGTFRIAEPTWHGGNGNSSPGCWQLNDVRVYNHALSSIEIKEIAKGLVLHYPLNKMGWGQENILLNTGFQSRYTQSTGWDTTKNGTQMASSWGGYNSGVTNQATVYHAHLKEFNGEWVYEYIKTANESWLGVSQGGLQSKLIAGKTYTFSWEEYHVDGTNRVGTGLYYYKTGATSANFHLGIQQASNVTRLVNQWQKYSYTFVAPSDADWSKNMSWYIYGHYNNNGTFYMRHPKLEEGSIATPWTPNSSDTLATTLNVNGIKIYDCSGYCNDGEIHDTTIIYNSDAPKYNIAMKNSEAYNSSNYPLKGNLALSDIEKMTVAFWAKPTTNGHQDSGIFSTTANSIPTDYQATAMNHYDGRIACTNISNTTANLTVSNQFTLNEWHHYCIVYDGAKVWFYKDGVSKASVAQTGKLKPFTSIFPFYSCAGGAHRTTSGNLSDLRIYATALSADDVKSLYQNEARIDSSGTIYGKIHN